MKQIKAAAFFLPNGHLCDSSINIKFCRIKSLNMRVDGGELSLNIFIRYTLSPWLPHGYQEYVNKIFCEHQNRTAQEQTRYLP